jgi:DNA invertase Pin-like site-specific DNA recombinase
MVKIPAAQYVRVSTEHQEYSIDCQITEIRRYADRNGFEIVQSYCDQ